jgi:aspartate kinase
MKIKVLKFGGTSVGDAQCFRRAIEIATRAAQETSVVVVVSAMSGVTNRLIAAAQQAARGDETGFRQLAKSLEQGHEAVISELVRDGARQKELFEQIQSITTEMSNICHGVTLLKELTPRAMAAVSCIGERLSARIMAAGLCEQSVPSVGVEATEVIITDTEYNQAEPLMDYVRERANEHLLPLLEQGITPVVTGFMGASADGAITTLGRGGSDYSATILGAALDAGEIIIWTDVDGVLTADPRLVKEARLLSEISYNEAAELAYFGAKVLHPKTLRPVAEAGIPVWIRNSFAPEQSGTCITQTGRPTKAGVRGITAITNVSLITVGGRGIVGVVGTAAKTFAAVAEARANVLLISQASSENDICLIVDSADAERTAAHLRAKFAADLMHHNVEHITVDSDVSIVAVVGEKMRGTTGIAGRTFSALGKREINIIAIAQGSSEYNVSFVVEAAAMRDAVNAVHQEFDLHLPAAGLQS